MEFFEKAHFVKSNVSKSKKSTENVKKQLKQMLYGYKVSDNKLIQSSDSFKNDFDDSASVSGFSDLNLTNSSHGDDTRDETTAHEESSMTDLSENLTSSNILDLNTKNLSSNDISNSDSQENVESLSEHVSDEEVLSSLNATEITGESDLSESLSDSEKFEVFDADGNLAEKIFKKLELTKNKKQIKKRKYDFTDINDSNEQVKETVLEIKNDINEITQTSQDDSASIIINESEFSYEFETDPKSPAFISITATDLPNQRLDEIIGEYRYSTIRNLPSENQDTIFSTNNSGIFTDEIVNVDIQTEDDVCSLIPEVDDIPAAEEIDKELATLDATGDTQIDESVNSPDNVLTSEIISETELSIIDDGINLKETYKIYYAKNSCIITLKHPCELFIQGKVKIKALGGMIDIFGYTLKDDICNIYAPYHNFALAIKTVENPNVYYGLFGKLSASGLSVSEAEDIVTSIGDQDGVILLQPLNQTSMDFVDNNFKATNLFLKQSKIIEPYFKRASELLKCSLFSAQPRKSFVEHPSWKEANYYAQNKQSRGLVCGGKGVGKSTFLRYQVNKLLSHGPVLVVDLDPGQCEFTVAGNVSATIVTTPLFGPNFTHLRKPEIMLNIGMINTMDNVKRYVSAVHNLITHCSNNEALANMPWIVNTMGMTNVLGLKFITLIIILLKPTYLLQYESKNVKKRFDTFLRPYNVKQLFDSYKRDYLFNNISYPYDLNYSFVVASDTEKSISNKFSLKPKDERYLNFLAYFSQLINGQNNLLGIVPYVVRLRDLYIGTNVIVKGDCITKVINGKVVALCQHTRLCDSVSAKVFTLSDKPLRCHGHGLIRGIDWEKETLYIITPVPSGVLGSVDTLLYADWVPELVGQESQLPKGTIIPYRTVTQDQHKQLMATPRRRFNPLQLIKMARNS